MYITSTARIVSMSKTAAGLREALRVVGEEEEGLG